MKKQSFSSNIKDLLKEHTYKRKCCTRAFADGAGIFNGNSAAAEMIRKGVSGLVCTECSSAFTAGIFVAAGNVSDPEKSYHLEFSFPDEDSADAASEALLNIGFEFGRCIRKGRHLLYLKNSTSIEDLLGYIGASSGAFDLMNVKIVKEMRETTNRQVNCDSANIAKTLGAAEKHIQIITELKDHDSFDFLPAELIETASLRIEYPDISIAELGQKFTRPISKSGVKHRLDKIVDFYESEKIKWNTKQEEQ